jgi:thiol-disulfide isomerase/thioredoxin
MLERALIALVVIAAGVALYYVYNRWTLHRLAKSASVDPLLSGAQVGIPTIVYFTTPFCVPCKTQQQPALADLQRQLGDAIQIIRVDAAEDTTTADRWGVFSAPTTFVLDGSLQPRHVNHGVATADVLRQQIQATFGG